jgi:adenosylmethionine-8-amino-7-oxononanoate aminotransferase
MSGDTIILAPPFVATEAEIREMVDIVRGVVGAL